MKISTTDTFPQTATEESAAQALTARARSVLFVPGDRPDRFPKAAASGADAVVIDLEDAVAPHARAEALRAAVKSLGPDREGGFRALVRVNPVGSLTHDEETTVLLEMAQHAPHGLMGLVVPQVESPCHLQQLGPQLSQLKLAMIPMVETARGIIDAREIGQSHGVTRLAFGSIDYALDIDAEVSDRVLNYPRSSLVAASRAAGVAAPLDSPSTDITNSTATAEAARRARSFGFGGKLCIHPYQVQSVHRAFRPTEAELQWARSVVGVGAGATQVDGQMIDRPVVDRARRILAAADAQMDYESVRSS